MPKRPAKPAAMRTAKLFENGRSLAVRIPRDLLPEGTKAGASVSVAKDGDYVVIGPPRRQTLADTIAWLRSLPPLDPQDDFPEIDDPPPEPVGCLDDWPEQPAKKKRRR